jgi:hypothetical protein
MTALRIPCAGSCDMRDQCANYHESDFAPLRRVRIFSCPTRADGSRKWFVPLQPVRDEPQRERRVA